jgi:hypothetical protein
MQKVAVALSNWPLIDDASRMTIKRHFDTLAAVAEKIHCF